MNSISKHKKILIAPLDWGLGHATRCIVIIRVLITLNCEVTIAASDKLKSLLEKEFPDIRFLHLAGYGISYSKSKRLLPFKILFQVPKILKKIKFENKWLADVLKTEKFDAVLADNRFGFYSKKIVSVFITHQLLIKTNNSWLDKEVQKINYKYINFFSKCWVPDFKNENNIAGALSHPKKLPFTPVEYIGPLSRFYHHKKENVAYKWMVIISGPEPQRSIFETKILEVASNCNDSFVIVRGLPGETGNNFNLSNCKVYNHLNTAEMQTAIEVSEYVISRCGYTTVMEILSMQKKSIFIPTPGQTEQEYLATHLLQQHWSYTFNQDENFIQNLKKAENFSYQLPQLNTELYKEVISEFVSSL